MASQPDRAADDRAVIVDKRELRSGVPDLLAEIAPVELSLLAAGDYQWHDVDGNLIIVERKAMGDFLTSAASTRLDAQLAALKKAADVPVLLLEGIQFQVNGKVATGGSPYPFKKALSLVRHRVTGWNEASYLGLLWSIVYSQGILVLPSADKRQSARLLATAFKLSQKESHGRLYRGSPRHHSDVQSAYTSAICLIPGLGEVDAARLKEHYPTLAALAGATPDALKAIRGMGAVKSKRVWEYFNN